jgi:hypothetical protein
MRVGSGVGVIVSEGVRVGVSVGSAVGGRVGVKVGLFVAVQVKDGIRVGLRTIIAGSNVSPASPIAVEGAKETNAVEVALLVVTGPNKIGASGL